MMLIYIKQHLSKIWSWIHENLSNTEIDLIKDVSYKKACIYLLKKCKACAREIAIITIRMW